MQYAVLLYVDAALEVSPQTPEWQASMPHHMAFNQALQERKLDYTGGVLTGNAAATSLRVRNGERVVSDGPFAEAKEQLWGYYVVDAPDLDTMLELSTLLWEADHGTVEIRPLMDVPVPEGAPGSGVGAPA